MKDEIYSCTENGHMKIRDGVTIDEISNEANELSDFISSIENAPEWRDVSVAELVERTRAVIEALDRIPKEINREEILGNLLENLLRLTQISYCYEFGHPPYCDMESNEVHRWMGKNKERFRKEKSSFVQFVASVFYWIGKNLKIG